jgi:hypothetical protein
LHNVVPPLHYMYSWLLGTFYGRLPVRGLWRTARSIQSNFGYIAAPLIKMMVWSVPEIMNARVKPLVRAVEPSETHTCTLHLTVASMAAKCQIKRSPRLPQIGISAVLRARGRQR